MNDKEKLLKILYQGFIEIREASFEGANSNKAFKIADLLHTIPLQISSASSSDDYQDVLNKLHKRATMKGLEKWVNNVLVQ